MLSVCGPGKCVPWTGLPAGTSVQYSARALRGRMDRHLYQVTLILADKGFDQSAMGCTICWWRPVSTYTSCSAVPSKAAEGTHCRQSPDCSYLMIPQKKKVKTTIFEEHLIIQEKLHRSCSWQITLRLGLSEPPLWGGRGSWHRGSRRRSILSILCTDDAVKLVKEIRFASGFEHWLVPRLWAWKDSCLEKSRGDRGHREAGNSFMKTRIKQFERKRHFHNRH